MSNVKSYFEIHASHHDYSHSPEFYLSVIKQIKSIIPTNNEANFWILDAVMGILLKP